MLQLGLLLKKQGQTDDAKLWLTRAADNPGHPHESGQAHYQLAILPGEAPEFRMVHLIKATELDATCAECFLERGQLEKASGHRDAACHDFQQALALATTDEKVARPAREYVADCNGIVSADGAQPGQKMP